MTAFTLTPEQEKARIDKLIAEFRAGLTELEAKTGMQAVAVLQPSVSRLDAVLMIVPKGA